jgi:hypothetical protein
MIKGLKKCNVQKKLCFITPSIVVLLLEIGVHHNITLAAHVSVKNSNVVLFHCRCIPEGR